MHYLIGIAGGSGSGKSTLAYALQDMFPDLIEVVHFDDYHSVEQVPIHHGMKNWDHPDAIDFVKLLQDLQSLKGGQSVEVMTKSEKYNPDYKKHGRIPHTINAKEVIIVEGYMALTDERIRELYDYSIFLDLPADKRMERRTKFINQEYVEKILLPMHKQYVEPTKKFADMLIDISNKDAKEVLDIALDKLKKQKIL